MGEGDQADIVMIGGGSAGVMAGMLFARAGAQVTVLEKHADFFRDFRGDTVHLSAMELLHELEMLGRFLERRNDRLDRAANGRVRQEPDGQPPPTVEGPSGSRRGGGLPGCTPLSSHSMR